MLLVIYSIITLFVQITTYCNFTFYALIITKLTHIQLYTADS